MSSVIALIDGEHYPPVVRFALASLASEYQVLAAAFIGGTEKVDLEAGHEHYGVPVVWGPDAATTLETAIERYCPHAVIDLSDEPIVSSTDRFRLASIALRHGVEYRGADFRFTPPRPRVTTTTPAMAIIGTGKRVGKTAVSAYVARRLKAAGTDIVVLAMGRGGPAEPEVIHGEEVALTVEDLLALARKGVHASSDNFEDAVMSRVTTVGCRRCGGGMAGETFFSNVVQGARVADGLGKELIVLEGSGAAIPPVAYDGALLVVGAGQGLSYVRDYFGPYRLATSDAVMVASAEEPVASAGDVDALVAFVREARPGIPVAVTTFRPVPLEPVEGASVFFATTAPEATVPLLVAHLESEYGCTVVGSSAHLSDRARLRADVRSAGGFDVLVTELKAAAIDVVAAAGEESGVPTVLCDNVPVPVGGDDLDEALDVVSTRALECGSVRGGER